MEARSETRAADIVPGINLEDPSSPESLWFAATVLQVTSPPRPTDPPAVTPTSAARQLFSPSQAPAASPTAAAQGPNDEHQAMLLAILKKKAENAAAAAAAAQELYLMEAAAVAAGLNIPITSDQVAAAAGSPIPPVAAVGILAQPAAAAVLQAPSVAAAVLPTQPTQSVAVSRNRSTHSGNGYNSCAGACTPQPTSAGACAGSHSNYSTCCTLESRPSNIQIFTRLPETAVRVMRCPAGHGPVRVTCQIQTG